MTSQADPSPLKHLGSHSGSRELREKQFSPNHMEREQLSPARKFPLTETRINGTNSPGMHFWISVLWLRLCQKVWPPPRSLGFPSALQIMVHKSKPLLAHNHICLTLRAPDVFGILLPAPAAFLTRDDAGLEKGTGVHTNVLQSTSFQSPQQPVCLPLTSSFKWALERFI